MERFRKKVESWIPSVALFSIGTVLLLNEKYVAAAIFGGLGFLVRPKNESGAHASHFSSHEPLGRVKVFQASSARLAQAEPAPSMSSESSKVHLFRQRQSTQFNPLSQKAA